MRDPIQGAGIDPGRLLGLLALLVLCGACLLVLRPFVSALLWAAILVYSTWPAYRVLRERLGLGASAACWRGCAPMPAAWRRKCSGCCWQCFPGWRRW